MAFIATLDSLPSARKGYRTNNPTTSYDGVHRAPKPAPPIVVNPSCIPRAYAYPRYTKLPCGPNNRGRYHLLRYACLRTTVRWLKLARSLRQEPLYHLFPMNYMPAGQLDRNPHPVAGTVKQNFKRATGIKEVVIPNGLEV